MNHISPAKERPSARNSAPVTSDGALAGVRWRCLDDGVRDSRHEELSSFLSRLLCASPQRVEAQRSTVRVALHSPVDTGVAKRRSASWLRLILIGK